MINRLLYIFIILLIAGCMVFSSLAYAYPDGEGNDIIPFNVGIGSFSPRGELDVDGTIYGRAMMLSSGNTVTEIVTAISAPTNLQIPTAVAVSSYVETQIANNAMMITEGDTTVRVFDTGANGRVIFSVNGSSSVVIDQNGNLGIGTSSPVYNLDIVNSEDPAFIRMQGPTGSSSGFQLGFGGSENWQFKTQGSADFIMRRFGVADVMTLYGTNAVANSFNINAGNIGLGTTEPVARLHVGVGGPSGTADLSSNSALIKGNLEVDGKIYGNGSVITGLDASQIYYSATFPTVRDALVKLLQSNSMSITSFSTTTQTYEVNSSASNLEFTFYVATPDDTENPAYIRITLPNGNGTVDIDPSVRTYEAANNRYVYRYTDPNTYTSNTANASYSWILVVNDGIKDSTAYAYIYFRNMQYYGVNVSPEAATVEAQLNAGSFSRQLGTARALYVTLLPNNQYLYVAFPTSWGFSKVSIAGFDESGVRTTISHTNLSGHTENYYIWRSTNLLTDTVNGYSLQVK